MSQLKQVITYSFIFLKQLVVCKHDIHIEEQFIILFSAWSNWYNKKL